MVLAIVRLHRWVLGASLWLLLRLQITYTFSYLEKTGRYVTYPITHKALWRPVPFMVTIVASSVLCVSRVDGFPHHPNSR